HDHGQETKHEIDRNDVADLIQLLSGFASEYVSLSTAWPKRCQGAKNMQEQQYHHNAHALHEVDMHPGAREPTEIYEQHSVAAYREKDNARPHRWEKAAEDPMPERKPRRRLERPHGMPQHHIGKEHAAYPDHGGKDMERYKQCHTLKLSYDFGPDSAASCMSALGH